MSNQRRKGALTVRRPVKLPPESMGVIRTVLASLRRRLADGPVGRFIRFAIERHPYVLGEHGAHCVIHPTAHVANALLNATSGIIRIGEYAFLSPGVSLLAGTHDARQTGLQRQLAIPSSGHDITICEGAWIAANSTVIGPSVIGRNAVVGAGSVVIGDVPDNAFFAGTPARLIRMLELPASPDQHQSGHAPQ